MSISCLLSKTRVQVDNTTACDFLSKVSSSDWVPGWLRIIVAVVSLATAVYVGVTTLLMISANWSSVPASDHWDLLIFSPEQVSLGWLFAQDHEHREAIPKLMLVDRR
jgi:hypothetical protein